MKEKRNSAEKQIILDLKNYLITAEKKEKYDLLEGYVKLAVI